MQLVNPQPSGVAIEEPEAFSCRLVASILLYVSTLQMTFTSPRGEVLTAISGGVVQSGWEGTIYKPSGTEVPWLDITITSWPSSIQNGQLWTIEVTCTDAGVS